MLSAAEQPRRRPQWPALARQSEQVPRLPRSPDQALGLVRAWDPVQAAAMAPANVPTKARARELGQGRGPERVPQPGLDPE